MDFLNSDPRGDLGSSHSQIMAKMAYSLSYLTKVLSKTFHSVAMDALSLELSVGMLLVRNGGQTRMLC